jgi:hypothetical protein
MKEEKIETERKMNEVFRKQNINFTGTGESAATHHSHGAGEEDDDEAAEYNPFGSLGYGYEAYFASLQTFGWFFIAMTILFLPAFFWYAEFAGLKQSTHGYYNSIMMLGNMGFNKAVCVSDYVQLGKIREIGCNVTGTMSSLQTYGLLPNTTSADNSDFYYGYCGNVDDMQANGYADNNDAKQCTNNFVNSTALTNFFNTNCEGTTGCALDFTQFLIDYNKNNGTNVCTTNPARFYIQYTCAEDDQLLN